MEREKQVCTIEQAKRLRELGINAPSIFYWTFKYDKAGQLYPPEAVEKAWISLGIAIPAYTVAELGEMLPKYYMTMKDSTGGFVCEDFDTYASPKYRYLQQNNEAAARAAMLIHLLENGIVPTSKTPEQ